MPPVSAAADSVRAAGGRRRRKDVLLAYVALTKPRIIELLLVTTVPALLQRTPPKAAIQRASYSAKAGNSVEIGDLEVRPFPVPHDAREPVQYVLSDGAAKLGVLTDAGISTAHVEKMLSGLDALVLECNYDYDMLWNGAYPRWLKERIGGPFGHLDNLESERLLGALDRSRLKHVIGAHLSRENNRPELARAALARAMGCEASWISLATQDEGFGWRDL